jgi:SAM-dependent methyltransferase
MVPVFKKAINRTLGRFGYELKRATPWRPMNSEWVSAEGMANRAYRPSQLGYATPPLGDDIRVRYIMYFLDVRGQRVLELGPRRGHHTVMLDKLGAREIVGVEGRPANLAICEQTKERYQTSATYVCQNIEDLAEGEPPQFEPGFDLVFCLGLLYHLPDPAIALRWMRSQAPVLFLGTHYVEPSARGHYKPHAFKDGFFEYGGRSYPAKLFREWGETDPEGGLSTYSTWLYEPDLIELVHEAGYSRVEVLGKDVQAMHPHITILADDLLPSTAR